MGGRSDSVFPTIDSGRSRNLSDALSIDGKTSTAKLGTSLIRLSEYLDHPSRVGIGDKLANVEAMEILRAYPILPQSVSDVAPLCGNVLAVSRCAWLHMLAVHEYKVPNAEAFFKAVGSGVMLAPDSPMYQLRAALIRERGAGNGYTVREAQAILIKAWNAWIDGRSMKLIRYSQTDSFPIVKFRK